RASLESVNRIVGIATTVEGSLITISSGQAKVLVESEGQIEAYVSDMNGTINKGDLLVVSPLKGILMKAPAAGTTNALGIATATLENYEIYDYQDDNETKQTKVGKIKVDLNYI